jgi:hypothetical protein
VSERRNHLPFQGHRERRPPAPNGIIRLQHRFSSWNVLKRWRNQLFAEKIPCLLCTRRTGGRPQKSGKGSSFKFTTFYEQFQWTGLNEDNSLLAACCAVPTMPIETNHWACIACQNAPLLFNRGRSPPGSKDGFSSRRKTGPTGGCPTPSTKYLSTSTIEP